MCTMNYEASATKAVNPSIVKMSFTIASKNEEVAKAIEELSALRKKSRKDIFLKESLIHESFSQSNIEVRPLYKTVETEEKVGDKVTKVKSTVFDTYEAMTTFNFNLSNADTIIDDFTDILNMAIDLKTKCYYDFDITADEKLQYSEDLMAEAIDNGIKSVKNIVDKSNEINNLIPYILEINTVDDNYYGETAYRGAAKGRSIAADISEYPDIITPELVVDIFNNKKIYLHATVKLIMDLKSSKAI